MKKVLPILAFLLILQTGFDAKAQFKIVGYVPNWINLTSFSSSFDYSRVTHLNLAFKDPNSSGDLPAMTSGETALITASHNNGVQVLLSLCGGGSSTNAGIRNTYFNLISDANRSAFCSKLKQYVLANDLDGLDLDLEGSAINSDYGDFVQELADSLHPVGKLLTSALSEGYGGSAVPSSTFAYFDWINIMAYDACGPTWGSPGQHSSYLMASNALSYWKGRGLAQSKAVLGLPFYGYEFGPSSPSAYAVSYKFMATNYPDYASDDQAPSGGGNTVYYNGIATIIDKTSLAKVSGGGVMIWELSLDATGDYSLLKYIRQVAGSAVAGNTMETKDTNLSLYPNPTTGMVTLEGDQLQHATIELYNTLGEKMRSWSGTHSIDLSEEPKGIYYLQVLKEGNRTIKRIIVQ